MQQLITNQFLEDAQLGREYYLSLRKNYNLQENAYIFIVDHTDPEFYLSSIVAIKNYIHKNEVVVYLLVDECIEEDENLCDFNCIFQSKRNIDNILSLYNLYMFTDRLCVFSTKLPCSRTAYHLVEQGVISMSEFIEIGLLKTKE